MEFGDYEDLPTAFLGGADESWNVRDWHCRSRREWLAGFWLRHEKNWRMFKWVSVTFNVQTLRREGRLVEICRALRSAHFIGLQSTSDRTEPEEDSPVYTTRAAKFRVYRFPWKQGSLFPSKHSGVPIAITENTFCEQNTLTRHIFSCLHACLTMSHVTLAQGVVCAMSPCFMRLCV